MTIAPKVAVDHFNSARFRVTVSHPEFGVFEQWIDKTPADDMDGGVTAALIEQEAEQALTFADRLGAAAVNAHQAREAEKDAKHLRGRCDDLEHRLNLAVMASEHNAERAEKAERERDEARATMEEYRSLATRYAAEPRPLTPDAMTAREHLDAAWEAAHVPADGIIPEGRMFLDRGTAGVVVVGAAGKDLASRGSSWERRLVDPPTPARPEGAEEWDEELGEMPAAQDFTPEQRARLADALAERDHALGVRVVGKGQP